MYKEDINYVALLFHTLAYQTISILHNYIPVS